VFLDSVRLILFVDFDAPSIDVARGDLEQQTTQIGIEESRLCAHGSLAHLPERRLVRACAAIPSGPSVGAPER